MRYFLDTEFMEDGRTIDLLSLALVSEDGREFYAVNAEADHSKANDFVRDAVLPHLRDDVGVNGAVAPLYIIARTVRAFVQIPPDDHPDYQALKPEFWGYYADYDWVVFCQLFGSMMDLPKGFPMYCRDIKQLCDCIGNPELPAQGKGEHHALLDARWNLVAFKFLENYAYFSRAGVVALTL